MDERKYRVSDFILDSLKRLGYYAAFCAVGFVAYAMTVGHIIKDEQVEAAAKSMNLCVYSALTLVLFTVIICAIHGKSVSRKALLIEAAREDDFDEKLYYKNVFVREVATFFAAGVLFLLPYAIFFEKFGFGYEISIFIDRIFATNTLFMIMLDAIPLGAIFAVIVQNLITSGILAMYLYTYQKKILADRMWLKDAPKQEHVYLKDSTKDRYKNY